MEMVWSILFGAIVGSALGLTGGGGSLLAVPLLVYGLHVAPREAFGISLAAVGALAAAGVIDRMRDGQVEFRTGALFAVAGMLGAPLGTWVAGLIPESVLLVLFSGLMLTIAWRIWHEARRLEVAVSGDEPPLALPGAVRVPACERTADGQLRLTSRCARLLALVGLATGFMSGMFGVGGGFVIVPALVMFSGLPIQRAIATSMLVMALVSVSGVASHFAAGRGLAFGLTGLFVAGGLGGLELGTLIGRRLPAQKLQKVFAVGIVAVALLIVGRAWW